MRKFLICGLLLSAASAQSQTLKFGDLNYFLTAGQVNVGAGVLWNNENSKISGVKQEAEAYLVDANFNYGLADNLTLKLGLGYAFLAEAKDGDVTWDVDGLRALELGAEARLMDQKSAGINLDFGVNAKINEIFDREFGGSSPKKDGNAFDPLMSTQDETRSSLEVYGKAGLKTDEANEFLLRAGVVYNKSSDVKDLSAGDDVEMDSSLDLKLGAFYQYRPVNEAMFTLGLEGIRYGEMDSEIAGIKMTRESFTDVRLSFAAKFLVNENLIARFDLTKDRRDTIEVEGMTVKKRQSTQYGLGVDFLF